MDGNKSNQLPKVLELSEAEIKSAMDQIKNSDLPDNVKDIAINSIKLSIWFPQKLQQKNISLSRLCKIIFGPGYKKGNPKPDNNETSSKKIEINATDKKKEEESISNDNGDIEQPLKSKNKSKASGHGRMPHTEYKNAEEITLTIDDMKAGDFCPTACGGMLRNYEPGHFIRIKGQNFAKVYRYTIDKLRCDLCGYLLTANIPESVGKEKYDASFKAILALQKYYVAVPFYRQEYFQKLLGFPLPDSTQWNLIEQLAGACYPVFEVLKRLAANSTLMQNDDTTLRILAYIQKIKHGLVERTGMYTTGILAKHEEFPIALFLNGTKHSGENVADILERRASGNEPIIQMCDALSANIPKDINTILCNCLSHGFRKFKELEDYFPDECINIMKLLGQVFNYDDETKDMSAAARLKHHQRYSEPIMSELEKYMASLLNDRLVEPNSELGKAIRYMQRHWPELTRFLHVAGAPIDNNIVERALKIAIRNRKNSMFYRTGYSANIGGMLTSLIYTCDLNEINPHHYLTQLQEYKYEVLMNPEKWLPWNYIETIETIVAGKKETSAGSPQENERPEKSQAAA